MVGEQEPYAMLRVLARPRAAVRRRVPAAGRRALAVFAGGALGTGLRALVSGVLPGEVLTFPWAVWAVNVSGSLLLGYLATRFLVTASRSTLTAPLLCTGLVGSYTTFSTFAVEVVGLVEGGRGSLAVLYGLSSVVAGVAAAVVGIRLAEARR